MTTALFYALGSIINHQPIAAFMHIAVNTRFLIPGKMEAYDYFVAEILKHITRQHPEHSFFFLFDREYDSRFLFSKNITPVVVGPSVRNRLLFKWWYDIKVPAILRKIKADIFVSPDGFCSLVTKVPQVLVVHDLAFLHNPGLFRKSELFFLRKYLSKYINKAGQVITVSEFLKQDIIKEYKTDPSIIHVTENAARDDFQPLDWKEKELVREKYTGGKEYFLCSAAIHPRSNLLNLLRAFSIFKKRQQSNMQLIIAGRTSWYTNAFAEKLLTYKYRNDVILTGDTGVADLARLTASAYASVFPGWLEGLGMPVMEAVQCGVPVITSTTGSMPEVGGNAALYADPANPEDLAMQMKLIFKDENLRNQLIESGTMQAKKYNWQKTANTFWECIRLAGISKDR